MVISERPQEDVASLLCALSFATGLGFGGHMEHGLGSAYLGQLIADSLALTEQEHEALFYGALLKDVACTACSAGISAFFPDGEQVLLADVILIDPSSMSDMIGWLGRYVRLDSHFPQRVTKLLSFLAQCAPLVRETMRSHCEVAELFARQLGFSDAVQETLRFQWERWDGKGMAYGLKSDTIPRTARILHLVQVLDLMYRMGGPDAACTLAKEKRGARFDPQAVDAFLALAERSSFWDTFEEQSTQDALLNLRPATLSAHAQHIPIEQMCEILGDFIDLKSRETWQHSRMVAEVAVNMAMQMSIKPEELSQLRCAALVHDLGKVAIPIAILAKGEACSPSEREIYRLYPYYTQRILEHVPILRDLAPAASAHLEWLNGQGYHRQLSGTHIPLHGRILAVADAYIKLLHQQQQTRDPVEVVREMRSQVDTRFDPACYSALVATLDHEGVADRELSVSRPQRVGNLTEREVEVLRLLAQGLRTPQIARELTISRKTVEHHVAHIYGKIGVTCQTAAAVYAFQHGLV